MKFLDILNESHEEDRDRMIKKGKTVFKALRKGIISDEGPDGLRFSYELSNDISVEKYEGPMNEGRVGNVGMGITDKELKKVKAVYKALKKGWFKRDKDTNYGYELPDDYHAHRDELGNVCIQMTGQSNQKPKFFTRVKLKLIDGTDSMTWQIDPKFTDLENWIKREVVGKFEQFNIKFIF